MANIGDPVREVEFEPLTAPTEAPAEPAPAPATPEREPVPAGAPA